MMELCTVFISGRAGYEEMTGETDPYKAMRMIQDKYHVEKGVILTAGGEGAYWYDGEHDIMLRHSDSRTGRYDRCRRLLYRWIAVFVRLEKKKTKLMH